LDCLRQAGIVKAFTAKQSANPAGVAKGIGLLKDAELMLFAQTSPVRTFVNLRNGNLRC
jgi:hypothetical protein